MTYNVDYKKAKSGFEVGLVFFLLGLIFLIIVLINGGAFNLIPVIICLLTIWVGASHTLKCLKREKIAKKLAVSGILVKDVPYEIINSGIFVFGKQSKAFEIKYTFPDGVTRTLVSHNIFSNIVKDRDGLCDFLYDPKNYDNFFIDLEIKLTGQGSPSIVYYDDNAALGYDNGLLQKKMIRMIYVY